MKGWSSVARRLATTLVLASITVACALSARSKPATGARTTDRVPGREWEFVAPQQAGYRGAALDSAVRYLGTLKTTAAMAAVGGRVLLSYGDVARVSYLASARKAVLSMLYGRYVASGAIRLDATLQDLGIDDVGGLSTAEKQARVADLLITSSGVYHAASNPGDNLVDAPPRGSQTPGAYFLYSNWDFNALGSIFEARTGRNVFDALASDLAQPIGMQDFDRAKQERTGDSTRSRHLAYHVWLSTRDMLRLGQLMLRDGRWDGVTIIPESWVRESTRLHVPAARMHPPSVAQGGIGYGYLWWVLQEPDTSALAGAYVARGAFGQYILVAPKLDLTIAHKRALSEDDEQPVSWDQFFTFVRMVAAARCATRCT